jgi:hypothetical protein
MKYCTHSLIVVDLLTSKATTTAIKIAGLLLREGGAKGDDDDATTRGLLRSCRALYNGIL